MKKRDLSLKPEHIAEYMSNEWTHYASNITRDGHRLLLKYNGFGDLLVTVEGATRYSGKSLIEATTVFNELLP